jgi:hypothetical protein
MLQAIVKWIAEYWPLWVILIVIAEYTVYRAQKEYNDALEALAVVCIKICWLLFGMGVLYYLVRAAVMSVPK